MSERKTINFGDIEVSEHGEENKIATINLQLPLRISFCGWRERDEYRKLALEDMRIKASVLFKIVEYFGDELGGGGYDGTTFSDFILVCGQIGQVLMETQDIIEMSFDKQSEAKK